MYSTTLDSHLFYPLDLRLDIKSWLSLIKQWLDIKSGWENESLIPVPQKQGQPHGKGRCLKGKPLDQCWLSAYINEQFHVKITWFWETFGRVRAGNDGMALTARPLQQNG